MKRPLRIGTRESQLAVWQATHVQQLLQEIGIESEIIFITTEGDQDTITPLYELGVQGIFTKTLDAALLNGRIDLAVHSMKDVPTLTAVGIRQAAVLKRASYKDVLVYKNLSQDMLDSIQDNSSISNILSSNIIASGSVRRKAQWLHRFPNDTIESIRGNVNTRLRKLNENNWNGVIFAAAGLERIQLRPEYSIDLDWMLPSPAQGAITISCRTEDVDAFLSCQSLNDSTTEMCVQIERDFLRTLIGGCSTPISALATREGDSIIFKGNVCSLDGSEKFEIYKEIPFSEGKDAGIKAANELLENEGAQRIINTIRNEK